MVCAFSINRCRACLANRCRRLVSDPMSILLGSATGFDRTYVSPLERGVRTPTLKTLFRLSGRLGVKPSDILRRVESKVAGTGKKRGARLSP